MTGVVVEFVGGPADGTLRVMECGEDGRPPTVIELPEFAGPSGPEMTIRAVRYELEVNSADDGPLWLYRRKRPVA
ncbi:hypothetical protein [Amycolatopsis sp. NPDC051128]|uniref:hypothetical protein n=1 Tax=Amycolatopsis sp. NPDC051128 TaxID=3155412 RepID=UPI00341230E7